MPYPQTKVHKFFFKDSGSSWNNPELYDANLKEMHEAYLAYIQSLEGYMSYEKKIIEENKMVITYWVSNEELARKFAASIEDENNPIVGSYVEAVRSKAKDNKATNYTMHMVIEYSNGSIVAVK